MNRMLAVFQCLQVFWLALFIGVVVLMVCSVIGVWRDVSSHIRRADEWRAQQQQQQQQQHLRVVENAQSFGTALAAATAAKIGTELLAATPAVPPSTSSLVTASSHSGQKVYVETLLSAHRPVTSDVRGNLGEPSVVTDESVADWLKDRWQSARNMRGEPIPGEHYLEIDLGESSSTFTKVLLDWEDAYCDSYSIFAHNGEGHQPGSLAGFRDWKKIASGKDAQITRPSKQHIIHELSIPQPSPAHSRKKKRQYRYVRLVMHAPSTQWAPSLWRFQVYGWLEQGRGAV